MVLFLGLFKFRIGRKLFKFPEAVNIIVAALQLSSLEEGNLRREFSFALLDFHVFALVRFSIRSHSFYC